MLSIPRTNLINLLKYDSLKVNHEYELVELVKKYFEIRKDIKSTEDPKISTRTEIWAALLPAEQNARTKVFTDEKAAKVKIEQEGFKIDTVNYQ